MPNQSVCPVPPSHKAMPRLNGGMLQGRTWSLRSLCKGEEPSLGHVRGVLCPGALVDESVRTPAKWELSVDG